MSALWNFFSSLFHKQQSDFEKYIAVILDKEGYILTDVIQISIEETKFKQKFAHVIVSKQKEKYIVLLILDEFHRDKPIIKRQKTTPEGPVLERLTFASENEAKAHVSKKAALYRIGHFDDKECSYYRVVKCGTEVLKNPDQHVLPGDYILRDLAGFNRASHAGVYVGRGKVIHYDDPDLKASVVNCVTGKGGHVVHVAPLEKFVTHAEQEIRILVHCFQQRTPDEKIAAAEELAKVQYGQYEYGIFSNNCQHLASLVSCGRLEMVDQEIVDSIQNIALIAFGMVLAGVAKTLYDYFFSKSDDRKNEEHA
uniref:LRAT domain-containing protein n=1 Tax=Panagrolaimus superbus TaxID=310955 RepID=A0A914YZX3_9BILA